jgi:hypothetical protein
LSLFNELQCVNRLVADCEIIGESTSGIQINNDNDSRRLISRINQKTSYLDVAAITSLSRTGNRIIKYQRKDNVFSSNIQMFDELLEPLSYPLFFPYGSGGWGIDSQIHFTDYLRSRILMPDLVRIVQFNEETEFTEVDIMNLSSDENNMLTIPKYLSNLDGTRSIPVNRFQCQSRLGQMYMTGL